MGPGLFQSFSLLKFVIPDIPNLRICPEQLINFYYSAVTITNAYVLEPVDIMPRTPLKVNPATLCVASLGRRPDSLDPRNQVTTVCLGPGDDVTLPLSSIARLFFFFSLPYFPAILTARARCQAAAGMASRGAGAVTITAVSLLDEAT